ncbi:Arc family DNA-binding protein [Bacillus cereus]|nr:Arc family DNA-binding protein [Bacillus cereus]MDA2572663.1 Arc family DNA-binding protein [Bacillus cereus]
MAQQTPKFTLRIPSELLEKLRSIAEENGRSVNKEIEILIKKHVANFEKKS